MIKYLCLGNDTIDPYWLPRWYNVPFEECIFRYDAQLSGSTKNGIYYSDMSRFDDNGSLDRQLDYIKNWPEIILYPLPKGSDYPQKLKELKLERLLHGI